MRTRSSFRPSHAQLLFACARAAPFWDAHAQLLFACARAAPFCLRTRRLLFELRMCISIWPAHLILTCACTSHFGLRNRILVLPAHAHLILTCACGGQNEINDQRTLLLITSSSTAFVLFYILVQKRFRRSSFMLLSLSTTRKYLFILSLSASMIKPGKKTVLLNISFSRFTLTTAVNCFSSTSISKFIITPKWSMAYDKIVHTLIKEQHKSSINFLTIHLNACTIIWTMMNIFCEAINVLSHRCQKFRSEVPPTHLCTQLDIVQIYEVKIVNK